MHVQVVEYNSDWRTSFDTEKNEIENILGSNLKAIYHIGSTSVEGLKSKPIIDILLVLEQVEDIDSFNEQFETLGYECMGEFGIAGRRYFRKGGNNRTHQMLSASYYLGSILTIVVRKIILVIENKSIII